jgi:hypothetical protein
VLKVGPLPDVGEALGADQAKALPVPGLTILKLNVWPTKPDWEDGAQAQSTGGGAMVTEQVSARLVDESLTVTV